jgi:diguanylate cyclase (GGDEF)-like protein/PAS domain S-box-containing protein
MNFEAIPFRTILDNLHDGVYFVDPARMIKYWNGGGERITGYGPREMLGRHCWDNILTHVDGEGVNLCERGCPLLETLRDGEFREAEVYLRHKQGYRVPVLVRVSPIRDSKKRIIGAVEIFSDDASRHAFVKKLKELERLSLIDSLSGLGNRRYVEMNVRAMLNEMLRYGWSFGMLFVDIDYFKRVNDTYGHDVGDEVLKMVAGTLSNNVRPFDVVGRWGGEEFVAIIANVDNEQLSGVAHKLRVLVEKSGVVVTGKIVGVTISIGATMSVGGDTLESVIKRADQLLYESKTAGRNLVTLG